MRAFPACSQIKTLGTAASQHINVGVMAPPMIIAKGQIDDMVAILRDARGSRGRICGARGFWQG
jgi:hypothetical protein